MSSEVELGCRVSAWLSEQDFEVYPEIQVHSYNPIADIVAKRRALLVVVELKTSLGMKVIDQAYGWNGMAHMIYVATPTEGRSRFATKVVGLLGLGHIVANEYEVRENVRPVFNRRAWTSDLLKALARANPQYAEAGNAKGRRWSPFQATCANVLRYVESHPGTRLKDIVENVKTHYTSSSTARACIATWTEAGKVPGVRLERQGRALTFWPTESVTPLTRRKEA